MLSLRRCCIGAALGLSLLACHPAEAAPLPFPVNNPNFQKVGPSIASWTASNNAKLTTGFASFTPSTASGGTVRQTASVSFKTSLSYVLSGYYSELGTFPNPVPPLSITPFPELLAYVRYNGGGTTHTNIAGGVGTTNHHSFHWTFTPAKSTGKLEFEGVGGAGGTWRISNLNPKVVPEVDPKAGAPAVALALGGLALMEERRRTKPAVGEAAD